MKTKNILGIETSCDETAAAVVACQSNVGEIKAKLKSNVVSSSLPFHKKTGGIIPEVAARQQAAAMIPVLKKALSKAKTSFSDLDAVAVTIGPGLIGSLLLGVETAKTLSFVFGLPLIPVNHLEGHLFAVFLPLREDCLIKLKIEFPAIVLIVSGGHTVLLLMEDFAEYKILGETLDDAAGEAFDKVAKLLGLGFPGGPAIAAEAAKLKVKDEKLKIKFPRPMLDSLDFNFSFSGLKTAVLYYLHPPRRFKGDRQQSPLNSSLTRKEKLRIVAKEFQEAVVEVLVKKTIAAAQKYRAKSILISGGVAANNCLRKEMKKEIKQKLPRAAFLLPESCFCSDNAAMIALTGASKYLKRQVKDWYDVRVELNPRL